MSTRERLLASLFATTLFVSAALLFWVQPLIAKMLLPLLGGTPAIWTTCMLFFQGMLLAGYAYVLVMFDRFGARRQAVIHLALLLLATLSFPIEISATAIQYLPSQKNPVFWLLACLLMTIGLPFFVVSASSPLLQKWFSQTRHPASHDPYFLFGASNLGSLLALLGYPLFMEPRFTLHQQSWLWAGVYGVLVILIFSCAIVLWRSDSSDVNQGNQAGSDEQHIASGAQTQTETLTLRRRLRWLLLAFIPSSLVLGVTTYISTDIATTPLLWVIPLGIYLLTFVLVFARKRMIPQRLIIRLMPGAAVILTFVFLSGATQPSWFLILLHLLFFFIAAMFCHGQMANDRPSTKHLTEFYLWLSIGGMLGGIFNALIAPNVFSRVVEYPLAIVLACLILPRSSVEKETSRYRWRDIGWPASLGLLTVGLSLLVKRFTLAPVEELAIVLGAPLMISYLFRNRPARLALAIGAIMLGSGFYSVAHDRTLHVERNFFGILRVTLDQSGTFRQLYHGNTMHGRQFTEPNRQCEPLSYYHRTGPTGQIFAAFNAHPASPDVAVVGLGTGAMGCYATPDQRWTFYEINPAVLSIARDTRYFTYLRNCVATRKVEVIFGDARLSLQDAPDRSYGLIALDAFSSDAIPVHLITRQAVELYLSKLADGGMLAFHISNRNLDLHPVLGNLAKSKNLICLGFDDLKPDPVNGKEGSQWAVMARHPSDLSSLAKDPRWRPVGERPDMPVWSDDFSNILSVFRWH